jgi:guanylate kinase
MLSPETQKRLQTAHSAEKTYRPNDTIAATLRKKTLTMIVAPAAAGKTFVINHLEQADKDFGAVSTFSTRDARSDDLPGMFQLYPHDDTSIDDLLDRIDAKEVVSYVIHPTSGRIYGTSIEGYTHTHNVLATLSSVVAQFRQLPFEKTVVIGLAVQPEVWRHRFHTRYPHKNDEYAKRIAEAISSLDWLLAPEQRSLIQWVDNTSDNPDQTIQSVINIVKYNYQGNPVAREYAKEMLAEAMRNT